MSVLRPLSAGSLNGLEEQFGVWPGAYRWHSRQAKSYSLPTIPIPIPISPPSTATLDT